MTANNDSALQGVIKFPLDGFDSSDPLDTGKVVDGLINNMEALYGGSVQTRVNMNLPSPKTVFSSGELDLTVASFSFPVTVLKDATAAPLWAEWTVSLGTGSSLSLMVRVRWDSSGGSFTTGETVQRYTISSTTATDYQYTFQLPGPVPEHTQFSRNHPDEAVPNFQIVQPRASVDFVIERGNSGTSLELHRVWVRESAFNAT